MLGEARRQLGGGVFAGVDSGHQVELGLGARDGLVGQHQSVEVIASQTTRSDLFPAVADVDPLGQIRIIDRQLGQGSIGLLDRAVAWETGDATYLAGNGLARLAEVSGFICVDLNPVTSLAQGGGFSWAQ